MKPAAESMKSADFIVVTIILVTFSFSSASAKEFRNGNIEQALEDESHDSKLRLSTGMIIAVGSLSFVAATLSSAGGVGGGGLFIPILTIVAGLDLKAASSFTALMVTGVSIANVVKNVFNASPTLIDYDIAILSEPCLLLGASIGVICNIVFPEWLITVLFAVFLAWSTFKTFKSGLKYWNLESEGIHGSSSMKYSDDIRESEQEQEQPLLVTESSLVLQHKFPWGKLGVLAIIWFSFFLLYLLHGGPDGQGIVPIQSCGVVYWIISASQIPLAILLTSWILYKKESTCNQQELGDDTKRQGPADKLIFPGVAFLAGVLSGVFGIGGGMFISPILLQLGIAPGVTAATCSFMVLFSSTMSAFQYILLGMDHIEVAIMLAVACFTGSFIGLVIVQKAIEKHGRASLIVFSVALVLALSTVLMTSFGVVDVWKDYKNGTYMGFKHPC